METCGGQHNSDESCCGWALPLQEVLKVFEETVNANMPMNNMSCNVLIDIFCKSGMLEKAQYVLRLAQKQRVHDCISFSTMIDAYDQSKEFDKMENTFSRMKMVGCSPNLATYNTLLKIYGQEGVIEDILEVLKKLEQGCKVG